MFFTGKKNIVKRKMSSINLWFSSCKPYLI